VAAPGDVRFLLIHFSVPHRLRDFQERSGQDDVSQAWRIGIAWVMFTVVFEFGAGHYLFGNFVGTAVSRLQSA
jgi:hypothetical protein